MKIKLIYAIGSLAIILTLCAGAWLLFQPKSMEPVVIYKTVEPEPLAAEITKEPLSQEAPKLKEKADQNKEIIIEGLKAVRGESDPHAAKLEKALNSPAYLEYVKSQEGTFGVNLGAWWAFLESQGLSSSRGLQEREFRELFPDGGSAADYEPEMRKKVAELALADLSLDTVKLLRTFWQQDKSNYIWSRQQFNGHVGDYDWVDNIRQNAGSIVAEFNTEVPTTSDIMPAIVPASGPMDVAEESIDTVPVQSEDTVSQSEIEPMPSTVEALDVELTKDIFRDIPNLPTMADFEKTFRESFSPQRFTTMMQTLTRYGPEEGLRRLKESDPEVATHIERLIQRPKETD